MATISAADLVELRRCAAKNSATQNWTKAQINAALQAIEDRLQLAATKTAISNDIEAVAPGVFTGPQKTLLFGVWAFNAARRLGVN